ncbi:DUF2332 domain-containing protein [Streptomyces sp. NPDC093970]|uniref:DUF2332 domain-containing protein n=1 Tax=Streptomyces sp. NPDC093970 TaxID=3155076 RepID=UPI00343226E8
MIPEQSIRSLRAMAAAMAGDMPVSGHLVAMLADDVERHGPIGEMVSGHPEAATPLFCLRVLAGVKMLVSSGRATDLAAHFEHFLSKTGDQDYEARGRELFRDTLFRYREEISAALDRPVQQHMPGRAGFLLRGLGMLRAPRIRLLELGACAGLNLILDQYRWFGVGWEWGDRNSSVRLAADGPNPGDFTIVERAGCDLAPRDPGDTHDAMVLRSFIPIERDIEELELDDALKLASASRIRVEKADAVSWLRNELAKPVEKGVYTVVWHSLFWWYLSPEEHAEVESIIATSARRMRLARICYEPPAWGKDLRLQTTVYS